jgi:hypothetical protein
MKGDILMKRSRVFGFFYLFICMMFLFPITACAYLDPSTITYVIQAVAGVFIAGGAAVGIYWHKIKAFFKKRKSNNVVKKESKSSPGK